MYWVDKTFKNNNKIEEYVRKHTQKQCNYIATALQAFDTVLHGWVVNIQQI